MQHFLAELLYNVFLAIIVSFLAWIAKKFWCYISKPTSIDLEEAELNLEKTKHQFYWSSLIFIASIITTFTIDSNYAKLIFGILSFFSFVLVWGAFDALYNFIKKTNHKDS